MPIATVKIGKPISGQSITLRYKGPFDYTYMARSVQRWFEQRRFKFHEARMKDTGKKMKVEWIGQRDIDEFYAEGYRVKIEMWNLSAKEIMVHGEPRKILNGMMEMSISGTITTDRAKFFQGKGKFITFLGKVLMDARWKEIQMKYLDMMQYRVQDIQTFIKQCLNMTTKENAPW